MPDLVETARAKINLTLRVIGRRAGGYHDIESLVAFADIADVLALEPAAATTLAVTGPFADRCGTRADNLVLKAARALGLPAGRFHLDKRIPVAAGLGGGSADAAAALRLIARLHGIAADDPRLKAAALSAGADVPVCLESRPRIMRGLGEDLSPPVTLPPLAAVLVNPGVPLATGHVFARFKASQPAGDSLGDVPQARDALLAWLAPRGNQLTDAATALVPEIGLVLGELAVAPGCRLSRMSGSGATCFGLFDGRSEAKKAAEELAGRHRNWWICPMTLG